MKQALVIGALGFVGFALCERLMEEGYEVIGIDYLKGKDSKIQEQKLLEITRNSLFTFINRQLEQIDLKTIGDGFELTYYCLLAHTINNENIQEVINSSTQNIQKICKFCLETSRQLIHLSSYEVFQEGQISQNSMNPRNNIGIVKAAEENEIRKFGEAHQEFSFYIVQLPTIYGPWQPDHYTFQQLIAGKSTPTIDPIKEDAIYIYDLAELLVSFPNHLQANQTVSLSSHKKQQWEEAVRLLNKSIPSSDKDKLQSSPVPDLNESSDEEFNRYIRTSITEGINQQRKHYTYLQKLKNKGLL